MAAPFISRLKRSMGWGIAYPGLKGLSIQTRPVFQVDTTGFFMGVSMKMKNVAGCKLLVKKPDTGYWIKDGLSFTSPPPGGRELRGGG